jgi:hypothetical protein
MERSHDEQPNSAPSLGGDPELANSLRDLQTLINEGRIEEARALVKDMTGRWPNSERVCHFARVLAPPVVTSRSSAARRTHRRERAWLNQHAHSHPGCWLAVLGDRLIKADRNLEAVLAAVRQTPGGDGALLDFQPGEMS